MFITTSQVKVREQSGKFDSRIGYYITTSSKMKIPGTMQCQNFMPELFDFHREISKRLLGEK